MPVFQPDGSDELVKWSPDIKAYSYPLTRFKCTERMAEVCPYRVHSPLPPPEKAKWYDCPNCGHRHRTEKARLLCAGYEAWRKAFKDWCDKFTPSTSTLQGTREQVYPQELLDFQGFSNMQRDYLWPFIAERIIERDKHKCQDCGLEADHWTSEHDNHTYWSTGASSNQHTDEYGVLRKDWIPFEVHHIIPRGMGGSDHPANLKLVCKNCHSKYNEKFNGEIISKKAQERKTKKLHETISSLESFEAGP